MTNNESRANRFVVTRCATINLKTINKLSKATDGARAM
jgi:hypothetical protein